MYKTYLVILFLILILGFSAFLILGRLPFSMRGIDYYCERTDGSFWSEPVNALTNLSFIVAGIGAITLLYKTGPKPLYMWLLADLMILIGIGSFLFHTFATPWAQLADVLSIFAFQLIFLWCYPRFAMEFGGLKTGGLFGLYLVLTVLSFWIPFDLNGSEVYLPALLMMGLYAGLAAKHSPSGTQLLIVATILFAVALTARTVDMWWCAAWPLGTHFLWHLLDGVVLYLSWLSLYRVEARAGVSSATA